jgi:hypothetical protein
MRAAKALSGRRICADFGGNHFPSPIRTAGNFAKMSYCGSMALTKMIGFRTQKKEFPNFQLIFNDGSGLYAHGHL